MIPAVPGINGLADISGRVYGVVVGVVTDNQDADGLGRVKVQLPWLAADAESAWARLAVAMAGPNRGTYLLPEVNDEVLVAFEHGDLRRPYVLGALWNGQDAPPETNADGNNNRRLIRSRSGATVLFDDTSGAEKIEIADATGKTKVVVDVAGKKVTIAAEGDIELSAPQGTIRISGQSVEMSSSAAMKIAATGTLDVQGQTVNIKGQPLINLN